MFTRLGKLDMYQLTQKIDHEFVERYGMNLRDAKIYRQHLDAAYSVFNGDVERIVESLAKERGFEYVEKTRPEETEIKKSGHLSP